MKHIFKYIKEHLSTPKDCKAFIIIKPGFLDYKDEIFDYDKHPGVNTIALMKEIKHHFRDKYGKDDMKNCMHSSDSLENVQREGKIIFN